MNVEKYLAFEETSTTKHEYVAGYVYAMAGAGWNHNVINGNVQTTLNSQLAGEDCAVVSSDMRLKVESESVSFRYPDTMVVCGEPDFVDGRVDTISNPVVIVEVLSPTTALTDLNEKLNEYIQIESLQAYLIISQHEAQIAVYARLETGWRYTPINGLDASFELKSIGCTLELAKLYEKTRNLKAE